MEGVLEYSVLRLDVTTRHLTISEDVYIQLLLLLDTSTIQLWVVGAHANPPFLATYSQPLQAIL